MSQMSHEEIKDKVFSIVSDILGTPKEKLTSTTSLVNDLGADSLAISDIMTKCEETFKLQILDEDMEGVKNIGGAIDFIYNHQTKK